MSESAQTPNQALITDLQDEIRAHANWQQRVDTTPKETGAKPSKNGIDAQDIAYDMWLEENASDEHAGNTLRGLVKADAEDQAKAERRERLRELARFNMSVKTGTATGEDAAYYYTQQEMQEQDQPQNAPTQEAPKESEDSEEAATEDVPTGEESESSPGEETVPEEAQPTVAIPARRFGDPVEGYEDTRSEEERQHDTEVAETLRNEELVALRNLRGEYLTLVAGRSRRAFLHGRKYSEESIQGARDAYEESRNKIVLRQMDHLLKLGMSAEEVETVAVIAAFNDERDLARSMRDHRLVATGNYQFNDDGQIEAVQKNFIGRRMNKFYEWFGSVNTSGKRFSKGALLKAGAMAAIGIPLGIAVGALAAPLGAGAIVGIGGAAIATRISKAYMSTHINKRGQDAIAGTHGQARHNEVLHRLGNGTGEESVSDIIAGQTKREVGRNRRRTIMVAGATAVGGVIGAELSNIWVGGYQHDANLEGPGSTDPTDTTATPGAGNNGNNGNHNSGNNPDDTGNKQGNGGHHEGQNSDNGEVAGFKQTDFVEAGHGYTHELQDLLAQKDVNLTDEQSYDMYNHLVQKFPEMNGNFFTDNPSYVRSQGDFGIGNSKMSTWDPRILEEINRYAEEEGLLDDAA